MDGRFWRAGIAAMALIAPLGCRTGPPWQEHDGVAATRSGARENAPLRVAATRSHEQSPFTGLVQVAFVAPPVGKAAKEDDVRVIPNPPVVPPPVANFSIDLPTALGLAGVENPTIALAQEAVRASLAQRLQADALLIPSLQAGASINVHRGNLLSARGIIRDVDRQSLYAGAGAVAIGGSTVGFPGVRLTAHLTDAIFEPVVARNRVAGRQFDAQAISNSVLLEVTTRYFDLMGTEARLATVMMRGRGSRFATLSISTPSREASRHTRWRIVALCSPMPPVKTR